jgi:hypothetical protein
MRLALPILLLGGCFGSKDLQKLLPDATASALTAQKLCYVFRHVKESCKVSENVVTVGDKAIKVETTVLYKKDVPGLALRHLMVEFSTDGQEPAFAVRSVAKGLNEQSTFDRGAQEWAAFAGTAVVDAMRSNGVSEAAHSVSKRKGDAPAVGQRGPFHVYPGVSDFRGAPEGGPFVDHAGLIEALASEIDTLDPNKSHSLLVSLKRDDASLTCEQGQVDGVDSGELCLRAASFSWAKPLSTYSVRQFYLLVPGTAASAPQVDGVMKDTDAAAAP